MKKLFSIVSAAGLSLILASSALAATPNLTDLQDSYAKTEIQALVDQGIVNGYPDNTFKPKANITRDEFAKLLSLALDLPLDKDASAKFTDVEDWARPYVGALVTAGLTEGTGEDTYGALDKLKREDMACFFIRAMGLEDRATQLMDDNVIASDFADKGDIENYALANIALAQKLGFIKGDGTNFKPDDPSERQAVARLVYEFTANFDKVYIPKLMMIELSAPISEDIPVELHTPTSIVMNEDGDYVATFENSDGALLNDEMTFTKNEVMDYTYMIYKAYRMFLGLGIDKSIWDDMGGDQDVFSLAALATWNLENSGVDLTNGFSMDDEAAVTKLTAAINNFYNDEANAGAILDEETLIKIATDREILAAQN